ncbi:MULTISPECIES: YbdK family carboxylate-amine ligase [Persephonella]|uniref:Putative glutamate--cysteine ligase 2 n=1 Tax=Persephonella marina (strain DSM 14350 / EX-H1) TaxID=123214 RepID=C0QT87_PERMH|nr:MULTISPECIES: YbdK family carboxylate-amine ligase [Persephonella]ACO04439.1 carboxylate-amine ligase Francci3_0693 [Persephonella marina EX-H1]
MKLDFRSSKPFTVGIELEIQLVDRGSFELSESSEIVFSNASEGLKKLLHPELLTSMVEIVTPVCETPEEAVSHIKNAVKEIDLIGEDYGFRSAALGTHVFAKKETIHITAKDRYLKLLEEFQILLKQFLIYGLHIHVGFPEKEMAIKAYNETLNNLPLFLAVSTSSPFFLGEFTGLNSFRTKIFEQLPRAGIPEYFDSYSDFEKLYFTLLENGFIQSIKDIWWDVRIHPDFGTVELRVCDSNPDMERIEFIATLFQAVCFYSSFSSGERYFHQILKQNKWNATRYSVEGRFLYREGTVQIKKRIADIIKELKKTDILKELGTEKRMEKLSDIIGKKSISQMMIEEYRKKGSIKELERFGFIE